jgi:hypothetical protein
MIIVFILLVLIFFLVLNNSMVLKKNKTDINDTNLKDTIPINTTTTDVNTIIPDDKNIPLNNIIDCSSDFTCYLSHLKECDKDTIYTQVGNLEYTGSGTQLDYKIKYLLNGFNENNQCVVSLTLEKYDYSFLDSKKQEYFNDNYTDADVNGLEKLLNQYTTYLVNKTGNCNLDVSSYDLNSTSNLFLKSMMTNISTNCAGDLFIIPSDTNKAPFFIIIN